MFQFPGFPPLELCIYSRVTGLQPAGFPHSDIKGSMPACGSPLLFAACHVLLRRLVPWHPPCALLRLITSILRLVTFTSGYSLTFSLQLVFQDFLSRLSSLCSCQGAWVISHPMFHVLLPSFSLLPVLRLFLYLLPMSVFLSES